MNDYSQKLKDPRWQRKRLEILQRDNFTCQCCGDEKSTLHVHHLYYQGEPWDVPNDMLVTLCYDCHEAETISLKEAKLDINQVFKNKRFDSECIRNIVFLVDGFSKEFVKSEFGISILSSVKDDPEIWDLVRAYYKKKYIKSNPETPIEILNLI